MNNLKNLIDSLGNKAQLVGALTLADVVADIDLLTVALCASGLDEIAHTLSFAKESQNRYIAAHKALDIGWNPTIREALASKGFFSDGVRGLLALAKSNSLAGSRLMPVFEELLSVHQDLRISKKLRCEIKNYINQKLETDGFAISFEEDGKILVKTANWVNDKFENIK